QVAQEVNERAVAGGGGPAIPVEAGGGAAPDAGLVVHRSGGRDASVISHCQLLPAQRAGGYSLRWEPCREPAGRSSPGFPVELLELPLPDPVEPAAVPPSGLPVVPPTGLPAPTPVRPALLPAAGLVGPAPSPPPTPAVDGRRSYCPRAPGQRCSWPHPDGEGLWGESQSPSSPSRWRGGRAERKRPATSPS